MHSRSRKWITAIVGIVVAAVLFYPVVGNLLLVTGALESIISRKPEKLKIQWDTAWTLLPGKVNVAGLHLDIHTKKNRIQIGVDQAVVEISLVPLLTRNVDIHYGDTHGVTFSHTQRKKTAQGSETGAGAATSDNPAPPPAAEPAEAAPSVPKKAKPPWTIQLSNISASDVRAIQFRDFKITGRGELRDFGMRVVTKGGPLRIDKIDLDMRVLADPDSDPDQTDAKYARLKADLRLAENIPKQNRGRKLLKFISGTLDVKGNAASIEFINPLLGDKYALEVSGGGELDMLVVVESGELIDGSRLLFTSEHFETDFLELHAGGSGRVEGVIDKKRAKPAKLDIGVTDFKLTRKGVPNPYMEGADLLVQSFAQRVFLHQEMEGPQLFVHFPDSQVRHLVDYNRFIPEQANVEILSGEGRLKGTMLLIGNTGNIELDLLGSNVMLDVNGNHIRTDLELVTRLSDGDYGKKSYDLAGTFFRMQDAQLVDEDEALEGWWGEIRMNKGDLLWTEPMDIDAEMQIAMRDTEPLIALLGDAKKEKKSLIDKALTIQNLSGTLGIQTNQDYIILDPILLNGEGLEVISKLEISEKSIDGDLYTKLHGIPVRFEINDNKAKWKGFGGKQKIRRRVRNPHTD